MTSVRCSQRDCTREASRISSVKAQGRRRKQQTLVSVWVCDEHGIEQSSTVPSRAKWALPKLSAKRPGA
jgi:hypothetical protein